MQRSHFMATGFRPTSSGTLSCYLRFALSFRYVEDLLAERGSDVSYETIRRRVT